MGLAIAYDQGLGVGVESDNERGLLYLAVSMYYPPRWAPGASRCSTSTFLEYIYPKRLKQLEREAAEVDARRKVQKALAQDNAL